MEKTSKVFWAGLGISIVSLILGAFALYITPIPLAFQLAILSLTVIIIGFLLIVIALWMKFKKRKEDLKAEQEAQKKEETKKIENLNKPPELW